MKRSRNRKGASSVLGAIFLIMVFIIFGAGFMMMQQQNSIFAQGINQSLREDLEQSKERLQITNVNYTVDSDTVFVELDIKNDGPIAVRIINLWITDGAINNFGYNDTLDIFLTPGELIGFSGSEPLSVSLPGAEDLHEFTSWFVTYRGNLIPLDDEKEDITYALLAQGIGSLVLDFDNFRYFRYQTPQKFVDFPSGTLGFNFPKNEYVAVGCLLKNLDQQKRTIVLDSHSLFWQPGRSGVAETGWFIVNVSDEGIVSASYTPIVIEYGETILFVFASQNDLGIGSFSRLRTPNAITTVATFLLLHGTIGGEPFGQNIPYVSVFYS